MAACIEAARVLELVQKLPDMGAMHKGLGAIESFIDAEKNQA